MVNPTRDTAAGRVYNDLRNLARRNSRSTDEIMVEYVLERFLYRLAASPLGREHFVLKGGLLLAQFGARRMTRDIDILGRAFPDEETEIIRRIAAIAATQIDDGVTFDPATLKTVPIREEDEYHGLRLTMALCLTGHHTAGVIARNYAPNDQHCWSTGSTRNRVPSRSKTCRASRQVSTERAST